MQIRKPNNIKISGLRNYSKKTYFDIHRLAIEVTSAKNLQHKISYDL